MTWLWFYAGGVASTCLEAIAEFDVKKHVPLTKTRWPATLVLTSILVFRLLFSLIWPLNILSRWLVTFRNEPNDDDLLETQAMLYAVTIMPEELCESSWGMSKRACIEKATYRMLSLMETRLHARGVKSARFFPPKEDA
jgi:hypothetical protein